MARMADLADARTSCYKAVVALAERLQPLSQHLRKQQRGAVAKVAAKMRVAFLAVAVILLSWPDTKLPSRYITGFRSLGMMEATGVLRQIPRIDAVPVAELLATAPAAFAAGIQPDAVQPTRLRISFENSFMSEEYAAMFASFGIRPRLFCRCR